MHIANLLTTNFMPFHLSDVEKLIAAGYRVCVERSSTRAIPDSDYEKVSGVAMVGSESWVKDAPISAYIVGLKELPEEKFPLIHRHIQFAHCYKRQGYVIAYLLT